MSTKFSEEVSSKEIRLPPFSSTNPEFWLEMVDARLSVRNNDNDQKYEHVKKHLCNGKDDYIIENFLEQSRCDGYLGDMYMGFREYVKQYQVFNLEFVESCTSRDLKPSSFLQHVSHVLSVIPKPIQRTFWLSRLPRRIQKVVMAAILKDPTPIEDWSLDSLASLADGVAAYEKYHSWSTLPDGDTIVLPPYDENDPELWFYSVDQAFSLKHITDDLVKFSSCIKVLRSNDIFTASLFLAELPTRTKTNQYDKLRDRIINTFTVIKGDAIYRLVFRNIDKLRPSIFFNLLHDLAARIDKVISQLEVRTLWMMQLPFKTQSILLKMVTALPEPLEDMEMDAVCWLADGAAYSEEKNGRLIGHLPDTGLKDDEVDTDKLDNELKMAKTLGERIALGVRYCDYMYQMYYDHYAL